MRSHPERLPSSARRRRFFIIGNGFANGKVAFDYAYHVNRASFARRRRGHWRDARRPDFARMLGVRCGQIGRPDRFARRRIISHSPRARRAANRPANIDSISEANGLTAYGCVNHSRLAKRTRQARSARCVDSGGA
ncbi:hypothetical protein WS67_05790 [Burkholderia singularis]|uniref:Uncharacterized protein n=1 Tax=Burkholderia singularis TaxID=1503053 RepID=A0A118DQD4_9BURK|nr:hypothetical protein WS67_05790 [Burkholderia singularis]